MIVTASSGDGSSSLTSWKRRVRAGSFSKYFLYSDQVVAAMVRSSPRASAGFSRLAASLPPAAPPAPISVWASSMNSTIGLGDAFTSSITPRRRFSNSPFTPAPACSRPRSRLSSSTFCINSGTSPSTIFRARPSTIADLPTPGSPTAIGLFLRRRPRISTISRISRSRANTGSILPERACSVTLMQNRPIALSSLIPAAAPGLPSPPPAAGFCRPSAADSSFEPSTIVSSLRRSSSTLMPSRRSM